MLIKCVLSLFLLGAFSRPVCANIFLDDLNFAKNLIQENHPGIYNISDPDFIPHMEQAYQEAKAALLADEMFDPLVTFSNSFNDSHLRIRPYIMNRMREYPKLYEIQYWERFPAYYIKLPTFEHSFPETQMSFDVVCNQLAQIDIHNVTLILDLRGNTGGNSANGRKVLTTLFGEEFVQDRLAIVNHNVSVAWRASPGNIAHLHHVQKELNLPGLNKIIEGMEKSLQENLPYYSVVWYPQPLENTMSLVLPKSRPDAIAVLIDGSNNSAALDFLDDLKALDIPFTLIGEPTCVDRLYMEVRRVALPSNKGYCDFPIKVYRNRVRGDNEGYIPNQTVHWPIPDPDLPQVILENLMAN